MKTPPQVFHTKEDPKTNFLLFPADLFAAINNKFSGNEAKVLLTFLGCKGDGSFSPSTAYMLNMTGIKHSNHYFATRIIEVYRKYFSFYQEAVENAELGNSEIQNISY